MRLLQDLFSALDLIVLITCSLSLSSIALSTAEIFSDEVNFIPHFLIFHVLLSQRQFSPLPCSLPSPRLTLSIHTFSFFFSFQSGEALELLDMEPSVDPSVAPCGPPLWTPLWTPLGTLQWGRCLIKPLAATPSRPLLCPWLRRPAGPCSPAPPPPSVEASFLRTHTL